MSESNNNYLGNPDRPVLVKESWAKRVQAATAATERDAAFYGETGRPAFALSRFYDMRPALLKSAWTQNSAGVYEATAAFIISDTGAVDTSFIFPVYWIPGGAAPAGEADETRIFVVWRGRWEALPVGGTLQIQPVQLASSWVKTDGIYQATARPLINTTADTTTTLNVCAPFFANTPPGVSGYRFWVVWRNERWESLQDYEQELFQPFRLQSAWALSGGIYRATAKKITSDAGAVSSSNFYVYAPTYTSAPKMTTGTTRFWGVWRKGRWELLQSVDPAETFQCQCVQLASAWTASGSVYTATANPVSDTGAVDTSTTLNVISNQFTSTPPGDVGYTRFWVAYKNSQWFAVLWNESDSADVSPMILNTSWTLGGNGVYYADCYKLTATGATDTSGGVVRVYAPASTGQPYGTNGQWKFWAVYRNDRWETIQPNFPPVNLDYQCVQLTSAWTLSGGVYSATANPVNTTGVVDTTTTLTVYAIQFTVTPPGSIGDRFWALWKNEKWLVVQVAQDGAGNEVIPVQMTTTWTLLNGLYYADCLPLTSAGAADSTAAVVRVWSIISPSDVAPYGTNGTRLWAVYHNDRWESLQPNFPPSEAGKNYTAGDGIDITRVTDTGNDYTIKNTGLRGARVWGNAYIESNGYLFLHPNHFQWYTGTAYDNTTLQLKTRALNVVTNIVNGQPQRELITVIDA